MVSRFLEVDVAQLNYEKEERHICHRLYVCVLRSMVRKKETDSNGSRLVAGSLLQLFT